jgi:hypothetical protein
MKDSDVLSHHSNYKAFLIYIIRVLYPYRMLLDCTV